jgi:hypothetical protein
VTIIEGEAVIVREVYARSLEGASPGQVARELNERGEVTVSGKPWQPYAVRHQHQSGEKLPQLPTTTVRTRRGGSIRPSTARVIEARGPVSARSGEEIRQRAQPGLQLVGCASHDFRIEAHPGHHHKHLLLGTVIDEHPTDVDRTVCPAQRNPGRFGRVT